MIDSLLGWTGKPGEKREKVGRKLMMGRKDTE